MSSMDKLRADLARVHEELSDVRGRLDALEGNAVPVQTTPPVTVTLTDTKPKAAPSTFTTASAKPKP